MEIYLVILSVVLIIVSIVLFISLRRALDVKDNLEEENTEIYKANETMEQWFLEFKNRISTAYQRIKTIDASGHFEADDEVGYFFTELKSIIERLYELGIMDEVEKKEIEEGTTKITTEKLQEVLSKRNTAVFTGKNV